MRSITCNTWDFTRTETNNNNNNKPNVKHLKIGKDLRDFTKIFITD